MENKVKIIQSLIDSIELAIQSYIKPGAYHRYSLDKDLTHYLRTVTAALSKYFAAIDLGEKVLKGRVSIPSLGLSNLIVNSMKDSIAKIGTSAVVDLHIPLITLTISASMLLYEKGEIQVSDLWRYYMQVLSGATWRDSVNFIDYIRKLGTEYALVLDDLGLTKSKVEVEGMTLLELFQVISRKIKSIKYVVNDVTLVRDCSSLIITEYLKYGDYNLAIVKAYISLLVNEVPREHKNKLSNLLKKELKGAEARFLLMLDKEMRNKGLRYNHLLIPLISSTYAALLSV